MLVDRVPPKMRSLSNAFFHGLLFQSKKCGPCFFQLHVYRSKSIYKHAFGRNHNLYFEFILSRSHPRSLKMTELKERDLWAVTTVNGKLLLF